MEQLSGQPASAGFAIGPALLLKNTDVQITSKASRGAATETETLKNALKKSAGDLLRLVQTSKQQNKTQSIEILEAHLMLLEDPEAQEQTLSRIQSGESAEKAYFDVIEEFRQMFLNVDDELIRQRAIDLHDIRNRVMFYIQNPQDNFPDLELGVPSILIARDLTPSQILSMDKSKLLGFVTVEGGGTSHTAILARSLEIPAIVGISEKILSVTEKDVVFLNAETGNIMLNPEPRDKESFIVAQSEYEKKIKVNLKFKGQSSETADGRKLTLAANISGPQDLQSFSKNDAESVGLYRTEFLFLDRETAPTEDEQYKVYKEVFDGLKGKHILVRTLDIGGDKKADYLKMKPEENPFLGIRALRLCFQRPEIFKTQLRALLRAGADANWGLMFPMVSQLEELLLAKAIVQDVSNELEAEGVKYSKIYQTGIMIEIPSAAWMINVLASHVDFISIGTNDLLQYTCAADRLNPDLKSIYNPYNVGFLRQIHHVLQTCADKKVHTGICGSLSHHPDLMSFFIGCGVDELSMTSQHILPTRGALRSLNYKECQALVERVLACDTSADVKDVFKR